MSTFRTLAKVRMKPFLQSLIAVLMCAGWLLPSPAAAQSSASPLNFSAAAGERTSFQLSQTKRQREKRRAYEERKRRENSPATSLEGRHGMDIALDLILGGMPGNQSAPYLGGVAVGVGAIYPNWSWTLSALINQTDFSSQDNSGDELQPGSFIGARGDVVLYPAPSMGPDLYVLGGISGGQWIYAVGRSPINMGFRVGAGVEGHRSKRKTNHNTLALPDIRTYGVRGVYRYLSGNDSTSKANSHALLAEFYLRFVLSDWD
jgi:hypothetical protein